MKKEKKRGEEIKTKLLKKRSELRAVYLPSLNVNTIPNIPRVCRSDPRKDKVKTEKSKIKVEVALHDTR